MPLPRKLDIGKAIKQKLKGMSYQEIAEAQNVTKATVHQNIAPILMQLPAAEELAEMKRTLADHYATTAYRSLAHITNEKLANASPKDLALIAGIATDKQRLIDGQSTSNSSIMLRAVLRSLGDGNNQEEVEDV